MRDRVALSTGTVAGALHLAFANRYDLFRDELYFIVCGQHPSFGYADQPPLVPLLAAAGYALGHQTWIVRLPEVVAAAALAYLAVAFVRLLRGGDGAAWIAGLAAAFAPMFVGLTATLNTTTFELVAWTGVAYLLARFALLDDRRAPLWAGVIAGLALEAKYALPVWLLALAVGLLLTPQRRILARGEVWLGFGIAALLAVPSLVWQGFHGWPFAELVHNAPRKDKPVAPLAFALNQLLVYGPLFAPLWIGGIVAPFALSTLRAVRFVSIAYAITAVATVAGHGKDYYLAPAVPALFVFGSVWLERTVRPAWVRRYAVVAVAGALPSLPIALPIVAPGSVVAYERAIGLAPQQQERGDASAAFPSLFADMLGWHDFVREVGTAYDGLPPVERRVTAILVDNYGEAAALDLYGAPYGLPHARSGHNQYYFWGPGPDASSVNILRVQDDLAALRPYCASVRLIGITHAPIARTFEQGKVIAFCRGVRPQLSRLWPDLKRII